MEQRHILPKIKIKEGSVRPRQDGVVPKTRFVGHGYLPRVVKAMQQPVTSWGNWDVVQYVGLATVQSSDLKFGESSRR